MNPDRVFVNKVKDLRRRGEIKTVVDDDPAYELLMAAPLLRELLIGEVTGLVNRERQLKLRFVVARASALEAMLLKHGAVFHSRGDGLYPGTALTAVETLELTRDQLLQERVMVVNGETVTIYHLIDYVANAAGGVHIGAGSPKHKRALLEEIGRHFMMLGLEAPLHSLRAVCLIVADGLQPLVDRAESDAAA